MKHLVYILFLLTVSFSACRQHSVYPSVMQQAEALMGTRPDSALHLLQSMADTVSMLPEEAQMYYHLLTIQAKDKQYITHTSDSLINHIVEFYENDKDKDHLMMAYYYQGSTYRDMNDAPRALKAFQQVVDLNVPNLELLAKTYNQMGTLFMYQGLHNEVIRVNRKSIEIYLSLGKRNKISYALRDIARMYDVKNMPDSALHYYKEACNTALMDGDSIKHDGILSEMGGSFYKRGNLSEAKRILKQMEQSKYIRNKAHIYSILGHLYDDLQLWDSSYLYKTKVLENGSIDKAYNSYVGLSLLEQKRGNNEKALQYLHYAQYLYLKKLPEYSGSKWEKKYETNQRLIGILKLEDYVDGHGNLLSSIPNDYLDLYLSMTLNDVFVNDKNYSNYSYDNSRYGTSNFQNLQTITINCEL